MWKCNVTSWLPTSLFFCREASGEITTTTSLYAPAPFLWDIMLFVAFGLLKLSLLNSLGECFVACGGV